ncbi:unnamed protein product [Linum trigynum]|uniref:Nudix hydrolase domain-containing protein n=1 Tax=Linum trigynum TaxID=586398 RepID=A0AAV2FJL9_9ROSI
MSTTPSRLVLESNNQFLIALSSGAFLVVEPEAYELNTTTIPTNVFSWKQAGIVGPGPGSTHEEMEVFGTVLTGAKVAEASRDIINLQALVNREGFTVMYFNVGAGDMYLRDASLMRRHNDLFDWSKYGVTVPKPVQTVWDRFQQAAGGEKMVSGEGVGPLKNDVEEIERAVEMLEVQVGVLKDELQVFV